MILLPDHLLPDILHLTDEFLDRQNIQGIIFDIDNTLVGYHTPEPTDDVKQLLAHLRDRGVKLAIASNNKEINFVVDPTNYNVNGQVKIKVTPLYIGNGSNRIIWSSDTQYLQYVPYNSFFLLDIHQLHIPLMQDTYS